MVDLFKVALFFETSAMNDRAMLRGITKYARLHGHGCFIVKGTLST